MCLALPMKVIRMETPNAALCDKDGVAHRVDMSFVGDCAPGTWVTVHMGIARDTMSEADAAQLKDALRALDMVRAGETEVDHLFADLLDREPPKPPSVG